MKLQLYQVLAIGFLVLLFFDAVQVRKCAYCRNVNENNLCRVKERTCESGLWNYCFTRKIYRGDEFKWAHQGCAERCISTRTYRRVVFMECCSDKDYCNREKLRRLMI